MQKKTMLKTGIFFLVLFSLFAGGVVYIAKEKLNPNELKVLLISEVQKIVPNANVKTSNVSLSLGLLRSSLNLNDFEISLNNEKNKPLFSVKNIEIKIPFWAIIFGGGKINLNIDKPLINYMEYEKLSNVEMAMLAKDNRGIKKDKPSEKTKRDGKDHNNLVFPGFIAASHLDVHIQNLNLNYSLRDKSSGTLKFEKLILKDLGLTTTTAFEVKSSVVLMKGHSNETSLSMLAIGETKLSDYLVDEKLKIRLAISLRNIKNPNLKREIGVLSVNTDLVLNKLNNISGSLKVLLEEKDFISSKLQRVDNKITFSDFKLTLGLKDVADIVLGPVLLPLKLTKSHQFKVSGSLNINDKITPNLKFSLSEPIEINSNALVLSSNLNGSFVKEDLKIVLDNDLWSGKSIVTLNTNLNLKNFNPKDLNPVNIQLENRDIKIPSSLLVSDQELGSKKNALEKNTNKTNKKEEELKKLPRLPFPVDYSTTFENIDINGIVANGALTIKGSGDSLLLESKKLKLDDSLVSLYVKTKILDYSLKNEISATVENFDLSSTEKFISTEEFKSITGKMSAKLNGFIEGEKFNLKLRTKVSEGEISQIDIRKMTEGLAENVSKYTSLSKSDLIFDGKFNKFELNGEFNENSHRYRSFTFIDNKKKVKVNGSGLVRLSGKSKLNLKVYAYSPLLKKKMKKEIGTTVLPIDLLGSGYDLVPNYKKTIKKVGKRVAKAQVRKQGKKQLKKIIDKQFEKNKDLNKLIKKEKVDKLLKGLFQ
ncbi:MAG: hypothetical protein VX341_05780 [Bdellovibrionota bacterium]|nr:hypothetical protein [Bdellovibrionota bacterium]